MKKSIVIIGLLIFLFKPAPAKAQLTAPAFCIGAIVGGGAIILYVNAKCYTPWYAVWDKDAPADCWCVKTSPRQMRIENWAKAAGPFKKPQPCYDFLNTTTNCPPVGSKPSEEPDDEPAVPVAVEKAPTPNGPWRQVAEIAASPTDDGFVLYVDVINDAQAFYRVVTLESESF